MRINQSMFDSDSDSDFEFDFVHPQRMRKRAAPTTPGEVKEKKKQKTVSVKGEGNQDAVAMRKTYKDLNGEQKSLVDFVVAAKEALSVREGATRKAWKARRNGEIQNTISKLFEECTTELEREEKIKKMEDETGLKGENGLHSSLRGVIGALNTLREREQDVVGVEKVAACVFHRRIKNPEVTISQLRWAVEIITHAFRYKVSTKKQTGVVKQINDLVLEHFLGM